MRSLAVVFATLIMCAPLAVSAASPSSAGLAVNANAAFVDAAFHVLLGRGADPQAVQSWSQMLANGADRSTIDNAIVSSAEFRQNEVNAVFQHFLGRGADPGSLQTYGNALGQGLTVQQIAVQLIASPEYFARNGSTNGGFVAALYRDVLGRPPSQNDLTTWGGQLSSNALTRMQVAQAIVGSVEGNAAFQRWFNGAVLHGSGPPTNLPLVQAALAEINALAPPPVATLPPVTPQEAYVNAAYQVILGRPADQNALASFSPRFEQGMTHKQFVQLLENSAEFAGREVDFLYEKFLGRHPDQTATVLGNFLTEGGTPVQVAITIVSSPEYFAKHGSTNSGFVDAVYQDVLGRHATGQELGNWTKLLAAGMTRTQFATLRITDGTSQVQDALVRGILHGSGAPSGASLVDAALADIDNALRAPRKR